NGAPGTSVAIPTRAAGSVPRAIRSHAAFRNRAPMAQLAASIVSHDEEFKRQVARLLRACGVPLSILEAPPGAEGADMVVVDIRSDASSGMAAVERLRASQPAVAIFAIAATAEPDLILQAMRAGANEFFPWIPGGATQASRTMEDSFHGAVRRTAAR